MAAPRRNAVCKQRGVERCVAFRQHRRQLRQLPASAAGVGYTFPAAMLHVSSELVLTAGGAAIAWVFAYVVARLFPGRTSFPEQIPDQMHGWPPRILAKR
jgi:hypothetical protein